MIAEAIHSLFNANSWDGANPRDPVLKKLFGAGLKTSAGVDVDEDTSLTYAAVFRAVSLISNSVAKLPLFVYRRTADGKERDKDHPAYRLLRRKPNDEMTAGVFRRTLQHHALLWGNGYAWIMRDNADRPMAMVPLLPDRTWPIRLQNDTERGLQEAGELVYVTRIKDKPWTIPSRDMLHIRGLGFDGLRGYGVVQYAKESLGLGLGAREFGSRFFGQGAISSGIIEMPGGMDEEAEENFKKSMQDAHGGLGKSHLLMILEEGSKFTATTIPPEQAQFLQTREFEIREVANWFGVQPHKLGDPSRKSYSSLEQSNQEHLDDGLDPWLCTWEEEIEDKVLSSAEKRGDTHFVEFVREGLIRVNMSAQTARFTAGRQWGWLSANDVLRTTNQSTIGPKGDIYTIPSNMMSAEKVIKGTETQDRDAALAKESRSTFVSEVDRMVRRISMQAKKKSTNPAAFLKWLDDRNVAGSGLLGNLPVMQDAVESPVRTFLIMSGHQIAGDRPSAISGRLARYVFDQFAKSLSAVVEQSPPKQLPAAVARAVEETGAPLSRTLLQQLEQEVIHDDE